MAFNVAASEGAQALDLNEVYDLLAGYGVRLSVGGGCAVSAASGMDLDVADGEVVFDGSVVSVSSQTVTVSSANGTYPRKDVVYIDTNGDAQITSGTAAEALPSGKTKADTYQPAVPSLSGTDAVVLAEIWVASGTSNIQSGDIRDRRIEAEVTLTDAQIAALDAIVQDDVDLSFGDDEDYLIRYNSGQNRLVFEHASSGSTATLNSNGDWEVDGDLIVNGSFDPDTITPTTVTVQSSLELPTYADNSNAVQEDAEIWFNDGSGADAAGIYYHDGSVQGPLDSGSGSSPGSLSGLSIDTDKDWAEFIITNMGHDGVRVPSARTLTIEDGEGGTLPDAYDGDTGEFDVQSSTVDEGSYAVRGDGSSSGTFYSITASGGLDAYLEPGDVGAVAVQLTDTDDIASVAIAESDAGDTVYLQIDAANDELEVRERNGGGQLASSTASVSSNLNAWLQVTEIAYELGGTVTATLTDGAGTDLATVSADIGEDVQPVAGFAMENANVAPTVYFDTYETTRRTREYVTQTETGTTELGNEVTPTGAFHGGPLEAELDGAQARSHVRTDASLSGGTDVSLVEDVLGTDAGLAAQADGDGFGYAVRSRQALDRVGRINTALMLAKETLSDTEYNSGQSGGTYTQQLTGFPRRIQVSHDGSASSDQYGGIRTPTIVAQPSLGDFAITFPNLSATKNDLNNKLFVGVGTVGTGTNPQFNGDGFYYYNDGSNDDALLVVESGSSNRNGASFDVDWSNNHDVTLAYANDTIHLFIDGQLAAQQDSPSFGSDAMVVQIQIKDDSGLSTSETVESERPIVEVLNE